MSHAHTPLRDSLADALIGAATTTEAGDLNLLLHLAQEVVIVREDDGRWNLHCLTDADNDNEAWVDGRVSEDQLCRWIGRNASVEIIVAGSDHIRDPR